jgi:hypothetical protein
MRRISLLLFIALILALPVAAQDNPPPDYVITVSDVGILSADGVFINVDVTVANRGGSAAETTTIRLVDPTGTVNINASKPLPALRTSQELTLTLNFDASLFPPGSRQPLRVEIISGTIVVRSQDFTLQMPAAQGTSGSDGEAPVLTLPGIGIQIDFNDPTQRGLIIGVAGAGIVLLLIFAIILRLLFQRPPTFGTWSPPYANVPPMNPDTVAGRRQMWQQHAQNSSLPNTCSEGAIQARKLLLGMDGVNLSGWKIIAVRMSQYDMYGRVARSQALAPNGLVKRLDRAVRKSRGLDAERISKRMKPIAGRLAGQFKQKINKRNAMLPVALDIRMQGTHGEVRIVFELFQCRTGQWQQLDGWEPEMTVISKAIHDSYTYTIYGQTGGETLKEFRHRLDTDLTRLLTELAVLRPMRVPTPETVPTVQTVEG